MKRQQNNCFPISRIKYRTNHSHMCSSPKLNRENKTRKKKKREEMQCSMQWKEAMSLSAPQQLKFVFQIAKQNSKHPETFIAKSSPGIPQCFFLFSHNCIYLFIRLLTPARAGSSLLRAGFLQSRREGAPLWLWCTGLLLPGRLSLQSTGSRAPGFSSCGT